MLTLQLSKLFDVAIILVLEFSLSFKDKYERTYSFIKSLFKSIQVHASLIPFFK